jgi:hypothetical protein
MRLGKNLTLVVVVALVHAFLLSGIERRRQAALVIKPLPEPVFLHLLRPSAGVTKPVPRKALAAAAALAHTRSAVVDFDRAEPQSTEPEPHNARDLVADPNPDSSPRTAEAAESSALSAADSAKPDPQPSDTWPSDTRVSYILRGNYRGTIQGSAKVQWQRQLERYQVQLEIRMALLFQVNLTSQGRTSASGLMPEAYEERFLSARRTVAFQDELLVLQDGRKVTKPAGVQDTASQFVELSHRFATGRQALAVGEHVKLWLARPGGVDLWTYDVTELVSLPIPQLGLVQAFHLQPRPLANPRGDIVAEIWLAPDLQYLPVRVRVALGGDNYADLLVEKIEQGDASPSSPPLASPQAKP